MMPCIVEYLCFLLMHWHLLQIRGAIQRLRTDGTLLPSVMLCCLVHLMHPSRILSSNTVVQGDKRDQ